MKSVEQLKKWRNTVLTKQTGLKANYLFSNEQAEQIVKISPMTVKELSQVPGFKIDGEKCRKIGPSIVKFMNSSDVFS